jgi:hypothetical protein
MLTPITAHVFPLTTTLSQKSITFRLRCMILLF